MKNRDFAVLIIKNLKWILILLLFLPGLLIEDQYIIHILVVILMYIFLAEAWNIIGGYAGQAFFGPMCFFGIGAYASSILLSRYNITPWCGMIIGGILSCIVATIYGLPSFRLRGAFFALASLAFLIILYYVALSWIDVTGGPLGISIPLIGDSPVYFQFNRKTPYYYIMLIFTIVIGYLTYRIENSKFGHYLVAIREDEDAAESVGVNSLKYKLVALNLSALFISICGTFYAQFFRYIDPYCVFSEDFSFEVILCALVGGSGTLAGPIIGSTILVTLSEYLRVTLGPEFIGAHLVVYGVLIIIILRFLPGGLMAGLHKLYTRFRKVGRKEGEN